MRAFEKIYNPSVSKQLIDFLSKANEHEQAEILQLLETFIAQRRGVLKDSPALIQLLNSLCHATSEDVSNQAINLSVKLALDSKNAMFLDPLFERKDDTTFHLLSNTMTQMTINFRHSPFDNKIVPFFRKCLKHTKSQIRLNAIRGLKFSPEMSILQEILNLPEDVDARVNAEITLLKTHLKSTQIQNHNRTHKIKYQPKPTKSWKSQQTMSSDTASYLLLRLIFLSIFFMYLFLGKCSG